MQKERLGKGAKSVPKKFQNLGLWQIEGTLKRTVYDESGLQVAMLTALKE